MPSCMVCNLYKNICLIAYVNRLKAVKTVGLLKQLGDAFMEIGSIEGSHAVPVHFLTPTHDVELDTFKVLNFVLFNNSLLSSELLFDEIVTVPGDFC